MAPGPTLLTNSVIYHSAKEIVMMYTQDGRVTVIMPNRDNDVSTSKEIVDQWLKSLGILIDAQTQPSLQKAVDHLNLLYELSRDHN